MRTGPSGGIGFFYIHIDNVNAPTRLTRTSDNAIMWRWDHDPYGTGAPDEDVDGNGAFVFFNGRFPGQMYDPESGLNYNYFRDYDPQTGRYVESDPIGLKGGLNTYAYASGRPVSLVDPRGLYALTVGAQYTFVESVPGNWWKWIAKIHMHDNALALTRAFLGQSSCSCVNCGSYWKLSECSNHLDIRVGVDYELTDHATQSAIRAEWDHIFDFKAGRSRIRRAGEATEAKQKRLDVLQQVGVRTRVVGCRDRGGMEGAGRDVA